MAMVSNPEFTGLPKNEYLVAPEHWEKELVEFRMRLLQLRPDGQVDLEVNEGEVMRLRSDFEASIAADSGEGWPIKGALTVVNALPLSYITSPDNHSQIEDRLLGTDILGAQARHDYEGIISDISHIKSIYTTEGLKIYNTTLGAIVNGFNRLLYDAISRGDTSAIGSRLLRLGAYWGATGNLELRSSIQVQIEDEYLLK
jgi:hypothetical protein